MQGGPRLRSEQFFTKGERQHQAPVANGVRGESCVSFSRSKKVKAGIKSLGPQG